MSRLDRLNGVAAGLASSFVSRNNDVDGYWAIGRLKAFALEQGQETVTVHLAPLGSNAEPLLEEIASAYRKMLDRLLATAGLPPDSVEQATVVTRFILSANEAAQVIPTTRGEPFASEVRLIDHHGKAHSSRSLSTCEPHDPWREQRSVRRRDA